MKVHSVKMWSDAALSASIDVEEPESAWVEGTRKPPTALECVSILTRDGSHYLVNTSTSRLVSATVKTVASEGNHTGSISTRVFKVAPGEEIYLGASGFHEGVYTYHYERTIVGAYFC